MTKQEKKSKKDESKKFELPKIKMELEEDAWHGIYAVLFFILTIFFVLAAFQKGGLVGTYSYDIFHHVFGLGYYLIPTIFFILSVSYITSSERRFALARILGSVLFFVSGLGILQILKSENGGVIGRWIGEPLLNLFGVYATPIILVGGLFISCFIIFNTRLKRAHFVSILNLFGKKKVPVVLNEEENKKIEEIITPPTPSLSKEGGKNPSTNSGQEKNKDSFIKEEGFMSLGASYTPPPLSLLEMDKGKPGVGDIKANANIIKRTLQNFGITVEMDEISIGPSVTRYALKPAEGVKLSRITGLENDLSLALAAHPIRIEAPIPGKSLVGIEIPNSIKTMVGLGSLLQNKDYQDSPKPLLVSLGKGVSGKPIFANVAKMPHLLIAGATGSGKSVTIHALITSLLFRNSPENLRLIMIDPKRVELTLYNKIPHLLTPVITDAKKAIMSLKWAAKEMDRRYDILQSHTVRDIDSYHKTILAPALKKGESMEGMPYIVIVIDELADIMQAYPRELEAGIVRLAQMSRAVGIHLMLSTQRPSVKVITGLIKANVPARLALQVASQIDSRTILDQGGAESLLGAGDMLYLSGEMPNPERIQSAFISENEVKEVVKFLSRNYDSLPSEVNMSGEAVTKDPIFSVANEEGGNNSDDVDDDLFEEVREEVIKSKKASTSYIQRKFSIGYGRAAKLLDILEEKGVIGPSNGSKAREVLIGQQENHDSPNE